MFAKLITKQANLLRNVTRSYHGSGRKTTMNDLPVPKGDWQEQYARKNSKYNMALFAGIATFTGTIAYLNNTNVVTFNFSPPKSID